MPRRLGGGRHNQYSRATLANVWNANAQNDTQARNTIVHQFGWILCMVSVGDVCCAVAVVLLTCQSNSESNNHHHHIMGQQSHCFVKSLMERTHWADFLWLAMVRVLSTALFLWAGLRYGRYHKPQQQEEDQSNQSNDENTLTEPLLSTNDNQEANDDGLEQQAPPDSTSTTTTDTTTQRRLSCCQIEPSTVQNVILLLLFVTSTGYQLYAGLQVSSLSHHAATTTTLTAILLCLTVFWVHANAYLIRVILNEVTRPEGKFSPHLHRHPLFFQSDRGLALHWCDLCRQRIQKSNNGCYRCPLCDFDVCINCANRSDAAVVGENVLRGDRGVREEVSLDNSSYFQRSMAVAQSEWPLLLVSFVLLAASSVTRLLLPHLQGKIIDHVLPREDGTYDRAGFKHYILLYVSFMMGQGAVSTLYSAIFTLVSRRLKFTIRNALLERILSQDVAYFDGTESGRLMSRLTNDLDLMMAPIQSSLSSLLSNVLLLVGGIAMCFYHSYRLSMLAFVTVGPITYLWEQYAQWSKGLAREMLAYWAEGNSVASQALLHVKTVKAFGCEDKVLKKYTEANQEALNCGVKDAWGNGLTSALTGYLDLGSGVLILWFGGRLVYEGEMSVGELVTFQGLVTSFTRSAAGAEKIFSLWDSEPDIDPSKGSDIDWDVQGAIEIKNVQFYYQMRPDNVVLDNFHLSIPAGKTVALVGRSGGGKSTIINLLLRFYDVKEGAITLDGREYPSLKVNKLRSMFGVVTQETELFALNVAENIAFGLDEDEYTMDDVIEAAKKAYAHEFICQMKDGYQTRIGERGNRLSGGQRQRLAIARVFLQKKRIILLDEATSALDENSQEAVQKALSTLIAESNATVVLVAHRLSTVKNADSIVVIDKGVALEQGNHDELVALGGIYASMVAKQHLKMADQLDQGNSKNKGESTQAQKKAVDDIDTLLDEHLDNKQQENAEQKESR